MKIFIIIMLTLLSFHTITRAQNGYVKRFHSDLSTNVRYSYHQMEKMAKSNNAYNFMALGYYLNANNNMYLKTRDITYLDNILSIIKPILIEDGAYNYKKGKWKLYTNKHKNNSVVYGQENLITEGYFFRYVGEFLDIISQDNLFQEYQTIIFNQLKYSFLKWKDRSYKKYDDYSLLFHLHLHTGANWAIVALYLNKYDSKNKNVYMKFINQYDNQLSKALQLKEKNGLKYYIWNSTYPEKFCESLKNLKKYTPVIQDVSHGNHVVLYLIKAKNLNNKNWEEFNFGYLSNTLKLKILKSNSISDNVDGTISKDLKGTGWKIFDGWLKLIYEDNTLQPLFTKSLSNYQSIIKISYLQIQFNSIYIENGEGVNF